MKLRNWGRITTKQQITTIDCSILKSTERRWREETAGEEPPTNASEFETPKGTAEMEVDPIEPPTDASKIESRKGTSDMEEDSESEKETPKETKIDKTELAREAERENDPT
ncbi:predicted protein [Arabidopsis lyrata subsp. lyrata]|uniref:Predicted protein n=1 Tax=Arabidopsis lyrata subsp. lyrata TaxID=81972 RepID=D7MTH0_ARALL|nr:predicted protein [Arabidopsis lyrata subsp. lyrata]